MLPFSSTDGGPEKRAPREDPRVVEECAALVRRMVFGLSLHPEPDGRDGAARERLRDLRPHLEEALAALGRMERHGDLTDQELACRRAFRMLLAAPDWAREGGLR